MDFSPVNVQKRLKSADNPVSGEELTSTAESNYAPSDLVEQFRSLGYEEEFPGPERVIATLKRS